MHGETYMTQLTFNEINRSPILFGHRKEESMESEPVLKNKRGRKRHSDEEGLSEADRIKKEKNRKAAQKCREKKEKEAQDLKNRNDELEKDNKKLSEEKKKLEERAQEFYRIIQDHMNKGCKLPPDVQEIFNEETKIISSNGNSEDCEIFRAVGTIEREQTPPLTPEGMSSGSQSPNLQYQLPNFTRSNTAAPTALFSGTPLTDEEITRRRSGSSSRSPSLSPALPLSPAKTVYQMTGKQLPYLFASHKKPLTLASKSPIRHESMHDGTSHITDFSREIVPTVVSDFDDESINTTEYISKAFEIIDRGSHNSMNVSTSKVIEAALQMPDVPCQDEVTKQISMESSNSLGTESNQNLPSLGFNCIDYSYAEDLQQTESVQEIIKYTNVVHQSRNQSFERQMSSGPSPGHSDNQPVVNVSACASAILNIGKDMSESLQQQIKTSYSNTSNSVLGTFSVSDLTQTMQIVNQQNAQKSGQGPVQLIQIKDKSGVGQPKLYVLTEQQMKADGLSLKHNLEESQTLTNQSSDLLYTLVSNDQSQTTMKPDLMTQIKFALQKQRAVQLKSRMNQEPHQLQRHISDQPLGSQSGMMNTVEQIQSSFLPSQSSLESDFQQGNQQQQLTIGSTASKFIQAQVIFSKDNSSIAHVRTLDNMLSKTEFQLPTVDYSATTESVDSSGPHLTPQYGYRVKEAARNGYVVFTTQASEASSQSVPTSSTSQAMVVEESDVTAYAPESTDYSANVQDLPSLNFMELQSEKNLFEKRRSGLTS